MSEQQRTEAWYADRMGNVTGSRFHEICVVSKRDGKPLLSRETAITEIALEILTGKPGAMWSSKATRWGNEHEAEARNQYEIETGNICKEVGFIKHAVHKGVGCSPDGLIGKDGGHEIKCPFTHAVHLKTLLNGMPEEHMYQVQGGMWVCDRQYWYFVSYHPDFPEGMQLYIQRIERDQKFINEMEDKVLTAYAEILTVVENILNKYSRK